MGPYKEPDNPWDCMDKFLRYQLFYWIHNKNSEGPVPQLQQ